MAASEDPSRGSACGSRKPLPHAAREIRACHRNEKRIERTLKKRGVISEDRVVIHQEWDAAAGVGRY